MLVSREDVYVAVNSDHHLCQRTRLQLSDFAEENFLSMHSSYSHFAAHLTRCCIKQGFEPKIFQYANEPQTLLAMVSAGMGVALLPQTLSKIRWPKVKFLRLNENAPSADLYLFYRRDEQSPVVRKFVQMIDHQQRTLNHWIVAPQHGPHHQVTQAGQIEHRLRHHRATNQQGQGQSDDGQHGHERIAQGVLEDRSEAAL